jgi:uncharacterized Zn-finger protein
MTLNKDKHIKITSSQLPVHCPMEEYDDYDGHPKVFLEVIGKETPCPYCGTVYELTDFDE